MFEVWVAIASLHSATSAKPCLGYVLYIRGLYLKLSFLILNSHFRDCSLTTIWIPQVKSIIGDLPVGEILAGAVTPPSGEAVATALRNLQQLAALEPPERLTPLGHHLSRMPMDARVGRMLIFGAMLRCLDPILIIAAAMGSKSPFYSPPDQRYFTVHYRGV